MTTAKEVLTNSFPPFPFFVENPADAHANALSASNNNHHSNLSSGYIDKNPLPGRCQFTFSDGRQCTMPRSEIHPALCRYHSEREDQLFGEPGSHVFGASLDLPELYSASHDLTTAAGVNRALGQVFRLLAQRRISRQEAATFGHLARLLLRAISLMAAESLTTIRPSSSRATNWSEGPLIYPPTPDESLPDNAHSRVPSNGVIPKTSSPISAPTLADRAGIGRSGEDEESRRRNGVPQDSTNKHFPPDAPAPALSSQRINTSVPYARNSPAISTSEIAGLNPVQNQHLQKSHNGMTSNSDQESGFPGALSFAAPTQASPGD
jgi:hypothetical protein